MKVVLLAGGLGTRFFEESRFRPKPMIEIGGQPILLHIMKEYAYYGYNDFIICAGYRQDYIKDWFNSYYIRNNDVTFDFSNGNKIVTLNAVSFEPFKVTIIDTGLNTMTGGRLKRVQRYIGNEPFMLTYGDGVCDVDISKLVRFHESHGKIATLTSVIQKQQKGILDVGGNNAVKSFREKSLADSQLINAGYMVFQPEIFEYLNDDETVLEQEPLEKLARDGQLMSYQHKGFWQCMDSARERETLEQLIAIGKAPWVKWND